MQMLKRLFYLCLLAALAGSCATVQYEENLSDYEDQIAELNNRALRNPNDSEALRDLGAIYFQSQEYARARDYLQKAATIDREDPKTLLYLGLSAEFDNQDDVALRIYEKYSTVSRLSRYRNLMEGRYRWLSRELAQRQVRTLINDPAEAPNLDPEAVAIFPLLYQGTDEQFRPLGRGLSEMMLTDLGNIDGLKMVERIRIEAIVKELQLSRSPYVDPATSPRHGKLVGAGKIIGGVFNVVNSEKLLLNASYWDTAGAGEPAVAEEDGLLSTLFETQKALLFKLLEEMNIELTPQQRERIQRIPTRNIQAFMAYCIGLEQLDAGQFGLASGSFQQALTLDPGFSIARKEVDAALNLSQAGGSRERGAEAAREGDELFAGSKSSGNKMLDARLKQLGDNVGIGFYPGEDQRKPADDADVSNTLPGDLPEPPDPPGP